MFSSDRHRRGRNRRMYMCMSFPRYSLLHNATHGYQTHSKLYSSTDVGNIYQKKPCFSALFVKAGIVAVPVEYVYCVRKPLEPAAVP